ncbi:hypothetical protein SPF06_10905 [Sinomonas sp. JGH33]|uniref:Uncharacterized protein n=1 Tax=Sinomonas terricola TaxID=3110330 RepID=A0ABU5T6Y7_9MICC|nr:hypothetical protein [Sinomonas sp. JGH33]MEA5455231.1 hypothetical protein [Sinomonas sp. JGH33]
MGRDPDVLSVRHVQYNVHLLLDREDRLLQRAAFPLHVHDHALSRAQQSIQGELREFRIAEPGSKTSASVGGLSTGNFDVLPEYSPANVIP